MLDKILWTTDFESSLLRPSLLSVGTSSVWVPIVYRILEPPHDKTNNVAVRPAKISLGIRPVWSAASLSAWRNLRSLATNWAQSEDSDQPLQTLIRLGGCPGWSESSLGAQSLCWFCHVAAHLRLRNVIYIPPLCFEVDSLQLVLLLSEKNTKNRTVKY